jgi:TonB family protein
MKPLKKATYTMLLASTMIFGVICMAPGRPYQEPDTVRLKQIAELQQKIDRNPNDAQALYDLGTNYEFSGHWPEAIDAYQRAARAKPDFAHAYYRLGWTQLAAGTVEAALKAHQQALAHTGVESFKLKLTAAQAHYAIGWAYYRLLRYDEAIASYQQALESDPGYFEALHEIGRVRIAQGNREEVLNIGRKLHPDLRDMLIKEMSPRLPGDRPGPDAGKKSESDRPPVSQPGVSVKPIEGGVQPMAATLKPTILYKEKAKYTESARENGIYGTVVLSVVFEADGTLTRMKVIRDLPYGLAAQAMTAAEKIRFQPAIKDGNPVSVRGNLEFTFNLY